jgi:hypothetical protein
MSKTKSGPSFLVVLVHLVLVLMTAGWWLIPLFIHYVGPKLTGKPTSVLMTAVHTFMTTITGGFWLIGLIIYWLLNN